MCFQGVYLGKAKRSITPAAVLVLVIFHSRWEVSCSIGRDLLTMAWALVVSYEFPLELNARHRRG